MLIDCFYCVTVTLCYTMSVVIFFEFSVHVVDGSVIIDSTSTKLIFPICVHLDAEGDAALQEDVAAVLPLSPCTQL